VQSRIGRIDNPIEIPTYTLVDAFCGSGGLSLGLEQAGFETKLAFDTNPIAVESYRRNISSIACVIDITHPSMEDVSSSLRQTGVDLIAGGPPCQGFSKQKRGAHLGDSRNALVREYAKFVRGIKPRFFLLENVDQLGQKRGIELVKIVEEILEDYDLIPHFYNAANYGVAQARRRFIIVGKRKSIKSEFRIPNPTIQKWITIRDAIGDLPEPPDDFTEHPNYPNHYRTNITKLNIERFSHVPQGGGWWNIPEHLRLECHKNVDVTSGGWPDVYGRLEWEGQAPTITAGFDSFTRGRYGHPESNRAITPREAARLQGFPDDFTFLGNRGDIRLQIGNAVPPPLAKAIGDEILKTLMVEDGYIEKDIRIGSQNSFIIQPSLF